MAMSIATADTMSESQDFSGVKRVRSANVGQLTKLYNELEKNMTSYDNIENVKQLYGKLCDRFEQFKSIHLQCLDLCTEPDAANDLEQSYERMKDTKRTSSSSRIGITSGCLDEIGLYLKMTTVAQMSVVSVRKRHLHWFRQSLN